MIITKESVAGTVESSDVMIFVSPASEISIEINSAVNKQFNEQIKETVVNVLKQLNITKVKVTLNDKGALDCVLQARLKAALLRASDNDTNWRDLI